jgi:photosystem II stability/assembly factor-like uncharacterized protein
VADLEERVRAHLARVVETPAPIGWEDRVSRRILGADEPRRHAWVTQVVAATALIAVAVGVFFGLRASRQNAADNPKPTPVTTPAPSPTASATTAPTPYFHTIHMFTSQSGWALTEQGVLRTTDGWAHWINVGPPGVTALAAGSQFVSETSAWVAAGNPAATRGTSTIYHTTDAGATWAQFILTDPAAVGPGDVDFIDATQGWLFLSYGVAAGSEGGAIYQTVDGGAHWTKVEQTVGGVQEAPGSLPFGCDKAGVSFINTTTGWATGSCAGGGPFFYVTHDGGRTWSAQSFPIPGGASGGGGFTTSLPVFFTDRSGYFILGGGETVAYTTTDGGTTWLPNRLPGGNSWQPFASIAFTSLSDAWLISADGALIYRTSDAGQHWTSFRPSSRLTGMQVFAAVDATHAIAVLNPSGSQNFISATSDGGRTWRQIEP